MKPPEPFDPEKYNLDGIWNDAHTSVLLRLECVDCARYFTWSANTKGLETIPDAVMFAARDHRELHSLRKYMHELFYSRDKHSGMLAALTRERAP